MGAETRAPCSGQEFKAADPNFPRYAPIVVDLKTMDGAGLEAEMMFKAGGDMVVVMGQAHDASIIEHLAGQNGAALR